MASNQSNVLLAGLNSQSNIHLIIGTNPLASTRCTQSLNAGAHPILIAPEGAELHYGLQKHIDAGDLKWEKKVFEDADLFRLGREEIDHVVDAVFVTLASRDQQIAAAISQVCKRNRIPINVVDAPHLCTFTLLSVHTDGPLQIGVTTNGRGCKLASRIRREIAASLPPKIGEACSRLGDVRKRIQEEDKLAASGDSDDSVDQTAQFNKLITAATENLKTRRMRWLSQVCEYWPLKRLAMIKDEDVEAMLSAYSAASSASVESSQANWVQGGKYDLEKRIGKVILAGSGPGHPDLLTQATLKAINNADLILADKLVPSGVLDLIPRRTPVQIARKFPGNADKAQEELLEMALAGVKEGKTVLRLKQGDPFIYGRGGEEVDFLRQHGYGDQVVVLPGITSALSAPLFAAIPPTQRDVADQVLICTGTGKKGKPPTPPEYVPSRTVVFLMALHRIGGLVEELTAHLPPIEQPEGQSAGEDDAASLAAHEERELKRTLWPKNTPCAVVERASCPDQRVIRTTLEHVAEAIESEGSRPPGLLIVGRACQALYKMESGRIWSVEEGFRGLEVDDVLSVLPELASP